MVMPCCCRHFWNAVRLAVVLALADAGVVLDVVLLVVLELLPQAAITTVVASVVRPSITRRARRGVFRTFMSVSFLEVSDQPAVPVLVEVAPAAGARGASAGVAHRGGGDRAAGALDALDHDLVAGPYRCLGDGLASW